MQAKFQIYVVKEQDQTTFSEFGDSQVRYRKMELDLREDGLTQLRFEVSIKPSQIGICDQN